MLSHSDRILLRLSLGPCTARFLSRKLAVDICTVHHMLRGLAADGLVTGMVRRGEGRMWRLASDVIVQLQPMCLEVARSGESVQRKGRCRAVTAKGQPCKVLSMPGGLCFLHHPLEPDMAELRRLAWDALTGTA
ncbi:MAG: helix-turn-helix domain-containing protein [Halobacteriales archaeon]|nr:helix-turn-helix domain-containing protein [Halobacteriales archaeon]